MGSLLSYRLYHSIWKTLDIIYPPSCAGCGQGGVRLCDTCRDQIQKIGKNICPICGNPSQREAPCDTCQESPPPYTALRSYCEYAGPVREAIHHLKYNNDLLLADTLAEFLITMLKELNWEFDLVLPVPISQQHLHDRGYNQAGLIAYPVALAMQKEYSDKHLQRTRETKSQVDLSAPERFKNLHNAFQGNSATLNHKKVLLVDDVTTTGATINSCSTALRQSGCERIYCITVAKTPKYHQ